MKHILLAALVLCVMGVASTGEAQGVKVSGYMAPNLRIIDNGEGNSANLGFGMAFNRFTFSGEIDAGAIVKKVAWNVEADISKPDAVALQNAYLQPKFNEMVSLRFGHVKKAFGREVLHPTTKLLTVDRSPACAETKKLGYSDFNHGLELMIAQHMFKVTAGAYAGLPVNKDIANQDPCLDLGARAVIMPTPCLEIGVNAMRVGLAEAIPDASTPDDTTDTYYPESPKKNIGMAFGFDLGLNRDFGDMNVQALVEFGAGDNTKAVKDATLAFADQEFHSFQYLTAKLLLKVTPDLGVHFGYSKWDPNTDSEKDASTMMTPGAVYWWSKTLRTQIEVQLSSTETDDDRTHFVLQQVFIW